MCGSSVWNLHHVTLVTPRILRWFLELWEICTPLSEQINYEYTNIAINPLILNCTQEFVCGYRVILGINIDRFPNEPVPVAARSKAWVCGRSPAEIVGSNPTGGMDVCLL